MIICSIHYSSKPPFIGIDSQSGIGFPNIEKLADAFGVGYYRIEKENTASSIAASVLESDGPCICEVIEDPNQNIEPKSSSKVLPDGRIVSPSMDDMAPFLSREEYEELRYVP